MTDSFAGYLVVGLSAAMIAASLRLRQAPAFPLVLLNRWLRWALFGFGVAYLLREWGGSERPYWALAPGAMLGWILVESVYTWMAVRALSLSAIPVYPDYRETSGEVKWPVAKAYVRVKDEIRDLGFRPEAHLAADLGGSLSMGSILYFNEDRTVRLQAIFAPRANGRPALFLVFACAAGESRWITDNVWLPFGGVFPASWSVDRRPFLFSAAKLFRRHQANLARWKAEPEPFEDDASDVLNDEQDTLDRVGTDRGILVPRGQRPEFGKLTGDGRYRIWKQILLLNYLGLVGRKESG